MGILIDNSQAEVQKAIDWLIENRKNSKYRIFGQEIQVMDGSGFLHIIIDGRPTLLYWVTPYTQKIDCPSEDAGPDFDSRQAIWVGYDGDYEIPFHFDGTGLRYEKFWEQWCRMCTAIIERDYKEQIAAYMKRISR